MDVKRLFRFRDLPHRVAFPHRVFLLLAASVPLLVLAFLLFGIVSFIQYEHERLTQPVFVKHAVPTLRRDDLKRFVRRLQNAPPPATSSPSPSPPSRRSQRIQPAP